MENDLSALERLAYSGRGITIGMTTQHDVYVGYTLTGRSESSKARVLCLEKSGVVSVKLRPDAQSIDRALLEYPAIVPLNKGVLASNGLHTNLLYTTFRSDPQLTPTGLLAGAFRKPCFVYDPSNDRWMDIATYEPDSFHTSRISGCVMPMTAGQGQVFQAALHIVKLELKMRRPELFSLTLEPGAAHTITTYKGGNEPDLPPFSGYPLPLMISETTAEGIVEVLYAAVRGSEQDYRVGAAVTLIRHDTHNQETAIRNTNSQGGSWEVRCNPPIKPD